MNYFFQIFLYYINLKTNKCYHVRFTSKFSDPSLNGYTIENIESIRDLVVTFDSKFTFILYVEIVTSKANRML